MIDGTVPHPSGGEYHPDHIQTPKEMPPVTKPAPTPAPQPQAEPEGTEPTVSEPEIEETPETE